MRKHLRIFVATGTGLPFARLLKALRALPMDTGIEVFVQRGDSGKSFADLPGADFISREEFRERLGWADIVVCHGGAGTIYEAYLSGHVPIVVPRLARFGEIVNDHQLELASRLATSGKAILCEDPSHLRDLVLSAKLRAEPVRVESDLVQAVRQELLSPSTTPMPKPGLLATAIALYRRVRS